MDTTKAVVQKVIRDGDHGPFVVATSEKIEGSVTFSLEPTVWKENEWPEEGMMVFLGELRQKRAGWRAKLARFWKPSDEQTQQIERSKKMEFLYPTSRQYPFDEVCGVIVSELEKRNWQVPGIAVTFDEYGSGEQKFRRVQCVSGEDFRLWFCRIQRTIPGGRWNDTAAVTQINIPMKEISVYEDESGPTLHIYVGNNWKRDRERFMSGSKVMSKLYHEPKWYLKYKGAWYKPGSENSGRTYPNRRAPYLVADNDLGREYDPNLLETKWFVTEKVMSEFTSWLKKNVLAVIVAQPVPDEKVDIFVKPAVPMPEPFGPIFCFAEYRDAERIIQGRVDPNKLEAPDRYGLSGGGYRLASLDVPNDGTVPEVAYAGFLWCGIGGVAPETDIEKLDVPGHQRWSDREQFVVRVMPASADEIYVADQAAYEKRRKEIWDAITDGRDRLTDAEVADFVRARARTIVPITEYKGGFEMPIVLINRELSFSEVEVVSGPHKEHRFRRSA